MAGNTTGNGVIVIFGRTDWEVDESSDAIEGKYMITIDRDGEEIAVIVHRTCGGRYPLNSNMAMSKVRDADMIVGALNAHGKGGSR